MKKLLQKNRISLLLFAAFLISGLFFAFRTEHYCSLLSSQLEAERWQGEGDAEFSQLSVFLPPSAETGTETVNSFRTALMTALDAASYPTDPVPFIDAYSCSGSLTVSSDRASTTSGVIAVGGSFFEFHPLKLLSGSYISEEDFSRDTVLLNEELAWLLFGSSDVAGLTIKAGGETFYVSGVVEQETDAASKKADSSSLCLYMLYDSYSYLTASSPAISCYELCMPNPVKNFALNLVSEKFPHEGGEILENSSRFSLKNLAATAKDISSLSISGAVSYPSWENAARYALSKAALCLLHSAVMFSASAVFLIAFAVKLTLKLKNKIRNKV